MIRKRSAWFMSITMLFILLLILRLAQIQLIAPESFSRHDVNLLEKSVDQRTQSWVLDEGRGRFMDRNGEPLTHDYYPMLVLFPFLERTNWPVEQVADILDIGEKELREAVMDIEEPFVYGSPKPMKLTESQMKKINQLKVPGVFAVHQQIEVDNTIANQLIGIVRENQELVEERYPEKVDNQIISHHTQIGITGLQKSFDEFLLPEGESKLLYHVDNKGNPLFGLNVRYTAPANPFYPTAIKTTINKEYQQIAEDIVDKQQIKKGGLVLLDVETSDILAMVSRPRTDPDNPFGDDGAYNHMLIPQFPGSVFKVVTATAALEKNAKLRGRSFDCNLNLYGDEKSHRELGTLDFSESFAQSCNYTFATLAKEMMEEDSNIIDKYADKLGLRNPVGWQGDVYHFQNFIQLPGEEQGTIWGGELDKEVDKAIAQTAIGQKEVKVTPLAVANMMATIARGGEKKQARAVESIQYKNGTTMFSFPQQKIDDNQISTFAATKLQELLRKVVKEGTGWRLNTLPYEVAGKSGTAETGQLKLVNKWFAGYFPAKEPKYALVVVDLEQESSQVKTIEVFSQLVEELYNLEEGNKIKKERLSFPF